MPVYPGCLPDCGTTATPPSTLTPYCATGMPLPAAHPLYSYASLPLPLWFPFPLAFRAIRCEHPCLLLGLCCLVCLPHDIFMS